MNSLIRLLLRFVFEKRRYLFYGYDPRQGGGQADAQITVYNRWEEIPRAYRRIAAAAPWRNAMFYRIRRGGARLLCCSPDGTRLEAYGWVQDWRPFRRRFGAVAVEGTMLGFYWTAPEARGRGLYGRLLAHSLAVCDRTRPVLIVTSPENKASQRGIEKAGFQPLGEWEARIWLRCFSRMRRISDGLR